MQPIGITSDCVCDLPENLLQRCGVDLMLFYITTDSGRFRDRYAITARNILEYLEEGGDKSVTSPPAPEEYRDFFRSHLRQYGEIIHVALSGNVGRSCRNALQAVELLGEDARRVTVVDSQQLSTGMGHLVLKAVELRDSGLSAGQIAEALLRLRDKVCTTFITQDARYLYHNGRVGRPVDRLCRGLRAHPVLAMRGGRITVRSILVGNYEQSVLRYVRRALKAHGTIDHRRLFITHAGCSVKMLSQIKAEAERLCRFDEVIVNQASATISSNFGPGMVGLLYIDQ